MVGEAAVREKGPELIRGSHETTLTEKVETLEQGLGEMLRGANEAVVESVEGLRAAVGTAAVAVQGAVHDMSGAVHDGVEVTAGAMGRALDLPSHVRRHPWLMVGGALLLGVALATLFGPGRR